MALPSIHMADGRQRKPIARVFIRSLSSSALRGQLEFRGLSVPCALGRSGITALKREGDGATPRGRFRFRSVLYRPDAGRPKASLPIARIRQSDGWCDSPQDRNYNRPVRLPYPASAERMWREDNLYDVVVVLGQNHVPRVRNKGSAIFMHIAREGFAPTEGCIALRGHDLKRVLARLPRHCEVVIGR